MCVQVNKSDGKSFSENPSCKVALLYNLRRASVSRIIRPFFVAKRGKKSCQHSSLSRPNLVTLILWLLVLWLKHESTGVELRTFPNSIHMLLHISFREQKLGICFVITALYFKGQVNWTTSWVLHIDAVTQNCFMGKNPRILKLFLWLKEA